MTFFDVPIRTNGSGGSGGDQNVEASWWNDLRTAGLLLLNYLGLGVVPWTTWAIANNQTAFQNIASAIVDPTLYQSAEIDFCVLRTDNAPTKKYERSKYLAISDGSSFTDFVPLGQAGNDTGMTFNLTSAGQLQYKSGNLTGTIAISKGAYRISTSGIFT